MKVAVIGTGYVGLVTGTCFSEAGNDVLCVDNNPEKLAMLRAGEVPIYEPGLETLFERNTKEGRLNFTDSLPQAVEFADIIFLALPTPPMEDGSADLKYVLGVANEIGTLLKSYKVLVNKSTVPVGTADKVRAAVASQTDVEFDVVSNPEFLREGFAVQDFMKPERIVIGSRSERAIEMMRRLYKPFVMSGNPIIFMDERSAEVTKYAANSFLATKISFMNEIANLCERVGADVDNVRRGIGTDSRIGKRFLFPGVGYGGSCFPKDVSALFKTSQEYAYDFKILRSVMEVNEKQKSVMVEKIIDFYGTENLSGKTFGVWGLAFKPNTDDIREAPALVIIDRLLRMGAKVKAYDPEAMEAVQKYTNLDIEYADNQYGALAGADALLLITEWNEFRTPDFDRMKASMNGHVLFDGRNVYDIETVESQGFTYFSIGRKSSTEQQSVSK
ncbi:MAG: UDP-glucose/GDP-mannose dehydrogenase family protein [Bacteroidetes bacterium]|nr:MAG: UDP-glucose/GDP-mannose dehydrogenase family protein [Bacteroidota bacterium]